MVSTVTTPKARAWIAHEEVGSDLAFARENPSRPAQVATEVEVTSAAEVARAVRAAHGSLGVWGDIDAHDRGEMLLLAVTSATGDGAYVAEVAAREIGKPVTDCAREVESAALIAAATVDDIPMLGEVRQAEGRASVRRSPFGVVAAIVPWNAPLNLAMAKIAPAVVAGNTVVLKPSPLAAGSTTAVFAAVAAMLPAGVLNVVQGHADTGASLIADDLVRKVSFTGGRDAAAHVMHACAERLVPSTMELGGNDAAIVLEDALLDEAALERAVWGTYRSAGQVCMAAKRWYVHHRRLAEFVDGFTRTANRLLVLGDASDPATTVGPVATADSRRRLREMLRTPGEEASARLLGEVTVDLDAPGAGYFVQPTLVTGAADEQAIVAEEQFGPIVSIQDFDSDDEVVRRANQTSFGLASSVWSADPERARALAWRLEAGYTFVNTHNIDGLSLETPFGGMKASGFGREFGGALNEYSTTHTVHMPAHANPRPREVSAPTA